MRVRVMARREAMMLSAAAVSIAAVTMEASSNAGDREGILQYKRTSRLMEGQKNGQFVLELAFSTATIW